MNQLKIASKLSASTHISVLLSTNTKNAPIQLVNHIRIRLHHTRNAPCAFSSSSSFFLNNGKDSFNAQSPNKRTKTQLNAFKLTAIVSFAIFSTDEIGDQAEKKKAIYACRRPIIPLAGPLFHHKIQ